jgi:hypothetical protein
VALCLKVATPEPHQKPRMPFVTQQVDGATVSQPATIEPLQSFCYTEDHLLALPEATDRRQPIANRVSLAKPSDQSRKLAGGWNRLILHMAAVIAWIDKAEHGINVVRPGGMFGESVRLDLGLLGQAHPCGDVHVDHIHQLLADLTAECEVVVSADFVPEPSIVSDRFRCRQQGRRVADGIHDMGTDDGEVRKAQLGEAMTSTCLRARMGLHWWIHRDGIVQMGPRWLHRDAPEKKVNVTEEQVLVYPIETPTFVPPGRVM